MQHRNHSINPQALASAKQSQPLVFYCIVKTSSRLVASTGHVSDRIAKIYCLVVKCVFMTDSHQSPKLTKFL